MSIDPQHVCYGCFQEKEPGTVCPACGFSENAERAYLAVPLGTILDGRYLIGKVLGVGGFGITYLGYDLTLDYKVAVKEYMPSGFATRGEDHYTLTVTSSSQQQAYDDGLDKFLSEARTLAKFHNTPNVVSVQDFFKENNTAYFVMEYVDGESLKDYLDRNGGRITYDEATKILFPIMKALSKVHAQGLIHRDISPDNISITSSGQPKLLDFGAARSAYAESKSVSVILKHGLAPIEQYSNHGNMGPWTDEYAMGATLYRSITGILPPESIERIHADSIRTPSSMGIMIPQHAELALMKALAVNPENRYANIDQFMDALIGKVSYAGAPAQIPMTQAAAPAVVPVQPQPVPVTTPQNNYYHGVQATPPATVYSAAQPVTAYGQGYAVNQNVTAAAPKKKGISKGAIVGIIVGCVAVLAIIGTIVGIAVANSGTAEPRHTTIETTDDEGGGHFGSKATTGFTMTSDDTDESSMESSGITSKGGTTGAAGASGGTVTNLGSLNASIWIPDGYVKNEKGFYSTTNGGFSITFAEMIKDTPVYGIDDVMNNKSFFIEYYLGKSVTETYSGRYTMPSGKVGFEIDGEYSGAKFILLAIPCHNDSQKAGCYFISSWFRTNDAGNQIIKAMKSFASTGDVETRLNYYSQDLISNPSSSSTPDVRLKFLFEKGFSSTFIKQGDFVSIINNKNVTNKSMVLYVYVDSGKSEEEVRSASKDRFIEEFKPNNVTLKSTKTTSVAYNGINWTIDTHDFERFTAQTITAVYPNGMVVSIQAKCTNTVKTKLNGYIKDLERSIRLAEVQ